MHNAEPLGKIEIVEVTKKQKCLRVLSYEAFGRVPQRTGCLVTKDTKRKVYMKIYAVCVWSNFFECYFYPYNRHDLNHIFIC